KVRRLGADGQVIAGFAGATADAFTLFERLEGKLEAHPGQLVRACVELAKDWRRSEEHTSELQSRENLVCRLLLEKKKNKTVKVKHRAFQPPQQYPTIDFHHRIGRRYEHGVGSVGGSKPM